MRAADAAMNMQIGMAMNQTGDDLGVGRVLSLLAMIRRDR